MRCGWSAVSFLACERQELLPGTSSSSPPKQPVLQQVLSADEASQLSGCARLEHGLAAAPTLLPPHRAGQAAPAHQLSAAAVEGRRRSARARIEKVPGVPPRAVCSCFVEHLVCRSDRNNIRCAQRSSEEPQARWERARTEEATVPYLAVQPALANGGGKGREGSEGDDGGDALGGGRHGSAVAALLNVEAAVQQRKQHNVVGCVLTNLIGTDARGGSDRMTSIDIITVACGRLRAPGCLVGRCSSTRWRQSTRRDPVQRPTCWILLVVANLELSDPGSPPAVPGAIDDSSSADDDTTMCTAFKRQKRRNHARHAPQAAAHEPANAHSRTIRNEEEEPSAALLLLGSLCSRPPAASWSRRRPRRKRIRSSPSRPPPLPPRAALLLQQPPRPPDRRPPAPLQFPLCRRHAHLRPRAPRRPARRGRRSPSGSGAARAAQASARRSAAARACSTWQVPAQ